MGNEYHAVRPHAPQNRAKIAAGSPLAVLGIFIEALRERFNAEANLGIVWNEDQQTSDIIIEAGYNVETEARDSGRALYINRLSTDPMQLAVGDRAGVSLPEHLEGFTCMMGSQMTIDCVSSDAGESAILADIVQSFFIASRQIFCAMYGFHDFGLASMGQTQPYEADQAKWNTVVSLVVQYQARWTTVKIRPKLQGYGLHMTQADFERVAGASLGRRWPVEPPPGPSDGHPLDVPAPVHVPVVAIPAGAIFMPRQPLSGAVDGLNRTFQSPVPFISGDIVAEVVYRNGVQVPRTAYTADVASSTITFLSAPLPNDTLLLDAYVETAQ
jgi:hypothetical protein